jgi:hypothetical protein
VKLIQKLVASVVTFSVVVTGVPQAAQANPYAAALGALKASYNVAYVEYKTFGVTNNDLIKSYGSCADHKTMAIAFANKHRLNYRYSNWWGTAAYFVRM